MSEFRLAIFLGLIVFIIIVLIDIRNALEILAGLR